MHVMMTSERVEDKRHEGVDRVKKVEVVGLPARPLYLVLPRRLESSNVLDDSNAMQYPLVLLLCETVAYENQVSEARAGPVSVWPGARGFRSRLGRRKER